jgi:hypothetical protein
VIVLDIDLFIICFDGYLINHLRDSEGFVTTWYDKDNDDGS